MLRLISITLLFAFSLGNALTHQAKSGSRDDVQAAINKAQIGDTVFIPAGNFVFNGGVSLKGGITIMGAGRDKTTLRRTSSGSTYMFTVNCSNGGQLVITGLTIVGLSPSMSPGIKLTNNCQDFRIYDNTFKKCMDRAIEIHGNTRGVIDHNIFIDNNLTAIVVFGDGDKGWQRKLELGSADAVYVEDNYFRQENIASSNMHHHIASNNGSRYVFRYNECDDGNLASSAVDAHGNKFYWPRGSRGYEVYGNTFKSGRRWVCINMRGGDGVIFDNKFFGSYSYPLQIMHEGKQGDGNCKYPCVDQIRQLYIWNNTYENKRFEIRTPHPNIIKLDRDYFLKEMPGYKPYTYPHPLTKSTADKDEKPTGVASMHKSLATGKTGFINFNNRQNIIEGQLSPEFAGQNLNVMIFNAQGKLVREISAKASLNGEFRFGLNDQHADLASGVYTLQLQSGSLELQKPLIISR